MDGDGGKHPPDCVRCKEKFSCNNKEDEVVGAGRKRL